MAGHGFLRTRKPSLPAGSSWPSSSTTAASWPKTGRPTAPGLSGIDGTVVIWNMPVSVCHQVISDRTRAVTDHIVEAAPSLRVDGLANRTEYAQTGQIVFAHPGVAKAHESANSGWSGVEASDAVVLNELPPAVGVWVRRTALMHEDGGTVEQRAVDEVGVSVNPARISSTPPAVLFLNVEVLLEGDVGANLVATMGMNDGLRLAGGSRGVQNEQWVF